MKKFYLQFFLLILIFMAPAGLYAQNVITEYTNVMQNNPWKVQSDFDRSDYTPVIDEEGLKMYVANHTVDQINSEEGTDDNVLLNIDLEFDLNTIFPFMVKVYNESGYENVNYFIGQDPMVLEVPEGTYDVSFQFYNMVTQTAIFVIKEQQEITGDTTLVMNPDEATNYVSINTLDENDEPLEPGVYNPETDSNSGMVFNRILQFLPSGLKVASDVYIWEFAFENDPVWNFYINDVSDRYSVLQFYIGYGNEENISYFGKIPAINGVSESIVIQNDPQEYVWHVEKFRPSPLNEDNKYLGFFTWITFDDFTDSGWRVFNSEIQVDPEESFKGYLNTPLGGSGNLLVYPAIGDYLVIDTEWGDEYPYFIQGNPVYTEDGSIYYGSGNTSNYFFIDNGVKELPFHPRFTFSKENNPDIFQGNSTPIAVSLPYLIPGEMNNMRLQYKGVYGEIRESDYFTVQAEVKQNGNLVYSGNYSGSFIPTSGAIELTLTNSNIQVEEMAGTNTTRLFYNAGQADIPPSLLTLQFRNSSEMIGNIFESVQGSEVRLTAGDHQYNPDTTLFSYIEGNSVEFYYSIYNEGNWTELELAQMPEYLQLPGFGDYYEASLESVVVPENNTWFDVKIICVDSAGHKQEQIISPAFKIEQATMGLEESDKSGFTVYPNPFTNELNVQLPENIKGNYTFKVVDVNGKMIYSELNKSENKFAWNGSNLPKGVYILSIENNGKTIAKKVIKK